MAPEPARLDVSIVVYHSTESELRETLASLRTSAERARDAELLGAVTVWLVDNGSAPGLLERCAAAALGEARGWLRIEVLRGHGNVGYGAGHDLAIHRAGGAYHLVLNPDVVLDADAVASALRFLARHPRVGMITPRGVSRDGRPLFLCKHYPSLLALGLRGFAPAAVRRPFRALLDRYEMRDLAADADRVGIPIASGCFMLARGEDLRAVGGFTSRYFLYFEDFDLSLRFGRRAEIAYVPAVRIVHAGGRAGRKGWAHRRAFLRSAWTFFRTHGWRLW